MKLAVRTGCAVVGFLLTACGSEMGDPSLSPDLQIALTATSTDEDAVAVRSDAAALNVAEAWVAFRAIEVVPCSADTASFAHAEVPVDVAGDPPAQVVFESGVTDYCAVRLEIVPSSSADPGELADLGLFVRGTRADGVPFEIRSARMFGVELAAMSGTAFDDGFLALGFDLATWFDGADVGAATESDGIAVIDSSSNADVLLAFEENTPAAVALYVDADRDGMLDQDELEAIAAGE